MLKVRRVTLATFLRDVVPFLAEREVEHNLLLGIAAQHAALAEPQTDAVWLAIESDGKLVGAAMRTPPHYVAVSALPPGAAHAIADFFIDLGAVPDGSSGPGTHGRDVLSALRERLGGKVELLSAETIYELSSVAELPPPRGVARVATESDTALLTAYFEAFIAEVALPRGMDAAAMASRHALAGTALVWEDGGPRALACRARKTPTGSAIAPVYTVPEARGQGYGTAVTAELSRRLLAAGDRFVCLFAEQKNPTANRVYQRIGYRRVLDFNVWTLA